MNDFVDEGEIIGVNIRRSKIDEDIVFNYGIFVGEMLFSFYDINGGVGSIVVIVSVEVRYFSCFIFNKSIVRFEVVFGNIFNERSSNGYIKVIVVVVIEEYEGFSILDDKIVDVYGDEININGVVFVYFLGNDEFGVDIVDGIDNDGCIGEIGLGEIDFFIEVIDYSVGVSVVGGGYGSFDVVDKFVFGIDVYISLGISEFVRSFWFMESMVSNVVVVVYVIKVDEFDVFICFVNSSMERFVNSICSNDMVIISD